MELRKKSEVSDNPPNTHTCQDATFEQNLLSTLLDNIPDLIFYKDIEDRYIRISDSLARLLHKPQEEIIGKSVKDLFSPELAALKMDNDHSVIERGNEIVDKEEYQPTADGSDRWLSTTKIPWRDREGTIIGMFGISRDITGRKQTERTLEQERARFQELYNNAPVGYQELDKEGKITQVNQTQADMLGYTVEELTGMTVFDLIPHGQRQNAMSRFGRRFEMPDTSARFERKYLRKDGSEIDLYIEDRIVRNDHGEPAGLRATLQDISELKQALCQVEYERNLLATLLEHIPDIIFFKDNEDRYIRISSSLARLFNRSPEDILGKTVQELLNPELADLRLHNDHEVIHAGKEIIAKEEFHPTTEGEARWLSTTKLPWYGENGRIVGLFGIARDITERKRYELLLEEERERFHELYNNAPVGYQELDRTGLILQVNKTEADMLGYSIEELTGMTVFDLIPSSQREIAQKRFQDRFAHPDRIARFERKYLRKNGSEIDLYIEDRIVRDGHGEPAGLRATLQDITELKQAQFELAQTIAAKERIQSELSVAHDIQASMLPRTFPPFPERSEFELFALIRPAKEVGGDFYDFFFIDEDHLCFCIGDVAGKGVPASLYMAVTRTLIKSKTIKGLTPDQVLTRVNEDLSLDNTSMFVTIFCAILDVKTGNLLYSNGGHNLPLISWNDGEYTQLNADGGIAVGVLADAVYSVHSVTLHAGDRLFLYTDGVTEATNVHEELYSCSRLYTALSEYKDKKVDKVLAGIVEDVNEFVGDAPQFDDITMLMIHYTGP